MGQSAHGAALGTGTARLLLQDGGLPAAGPWGASPGRCSLRGAGCRGPAHIRYIDPDFYPRGRMLASRVLCAALLATAAVRSSSPAQTVRDTASRTLLV